MKRYFLYLLTAILGMLNIQPASAQQTQDALYIFRNDGAFNGFFYDDIDHISYSKVDTLGVEHDDYVVQEVYALDSVFRIPISAIDSVAFVTPETQYKKDVAHTTESDLWNYVIDSDSLTWIMLHSNTPAALIPNIGQKLVTLNQTAILPAGFAGRVASVGNTEKGFKIVCETLDLAEFFDQYVCKVSAIAGSDEAAARRRAEGGGKVHIPLPEVSVTAQLTRSWGGDFSIDGTGTIGLKLKPTLDLRAFLSVGLGEATNFDIIVRGELETQVSASISGNVTGHFDKKMGPEFNIPVPNMPLFFFNAQQGFFIELQGSVSFGFSFTTINSIYMIGQYNGLKEGNRQFSLSLHNVKNELKWEKVEGKFTLSGGPYFQDAINILDGSVGSTGTRINMGYRTDVTAQLDWENLSKQASEISTPDNTYQKLLRGFYDLVDKNTKTSSQIFLNGQGFTKALGWQKTGTVEAAINLGEGGLIPHFGKPTVRLMSPSSDRVYIDVPMERSVLLSNKVGYDIYNCQGKLVKELVRDSLYTGKSETLTMGLEPLGEGQKYIAFPRTELFGLKMYAEPTDSFTTDKPDFKIPEKQLIVPSAYGSADVKILTNISDIRFETTDKWLSCLYKPEKQVVTVYYDAMSGSQNERKGSITVTAHDGDGTLLFTDRISVTQIQASLELSSREFHVGVKGSTCIVTVTATNTKNIQVSTQSTFIHPEINGNTISIVIDENPSKESRSGIISVVGTMGETNQKIERFIDIEQDGTETPQEVKLLTTVSTKARVTSSKIPFSDWEGNNTMTISVHPNDNGKLTQVGKYLHYRNADAKHERLGEDSWSDTSWTIEATIEPVSDQSLYSYKLLDGTVSYLYERYKENQRTESERFSYNLKELAKVDISASGNGGSIEFYPLIILDSWTDLHKWDAKLSDYMDGFSYERTGENPLSLSQSDLEEMHYRNQEEANSLDGNSQWGLSISFDIEEGTPLLEPDIWLIERDNGRWFFETISFKSNSLVSDITYRSSDEWLTVTKNNAYNWFNLDVSANTSKADRVGYIYLEGKLSDGSKLTRTITIKQPYRREDDHTTETYEDEKPSLPSGKVMEALQEAGMPLYLGTNPPNINGTYEMKPAITAYANYEDNESFEGSVVVRIASMIASEPRAKVDWYTILPEYGAMGATERICYLGGDGKRFTTSNIYTYTIEDSSGTNVYTTITVCSGEIDGDNIKNLYFADVELSETGEIEHIVIVKDEDGISTPTSWEPGEDPWEDEDWGDDDDWEVRKRAARANRGRVARANRVSVGM
jgi:hypothetical protein